MSQEQRLEAKLRRQQAVAMAKLLSGLLGNAPVEKIMAGEGCSWDMTPKQTKGAMDGVVDYVKAVKGEDVKWNK